MKAAAKKQTAVAAHAPFFLFRHLPYTCTAHAGTVTLLPIFSPSASIPKRFTLPVLPFFPSCLTSIPKAYTENIRIGFRNGILHLQVI